MKLTELTVTDKPPVKEPAKEADKKPGGANVMLLNDPKTPGMLVIEAVCHATKIGTEEAIRRVLKANKEGWSIVATYGTRDQAETVAKKILDYVHGDNRYDMYRSIVKHTGKWPLAVEVMDAE